MKTRKEIEEEFQGNEIKNGIQKEKEELKIYLSAFLNELKNVSVPVQHNYKLSDEATIKELKTTLESVNIPEEVKLIRESKIVFDDKTSKWLVWWSWFSYVAFFLFIVWITLLYKNRVSESDYNSLKSNSNYNHYLLKEIEEKAPKTYKNVKDRFDIEIKK